MAIVNKRQKGNKRRAQGRFNARANSQSRMNSIHSVRGGKRL